jgi:hypothetical protein
MTKDNVTCYCTCHSDGRERCDNCCVKTERERCAKIAEDERVDAEDTQHAADIAYNDACMDVARTIRELT